MLGAELYARESQFSFERKNLTKCGSVCVRGAALLLLCATISCVPKKSMSDSVPFTKEDPWRIFRIMAEFVESFETMSQIGPAVTIFGSARLLPNDPFYQAALHLAKGLAKHN